MKLEFELACQSCAREQIITVQKGDPWPLLRCSFCENRLDIRHWTSDVETATLSDSVDRANASPPLQHRSAEENQPITIEDPLVHHRAAEGHNGPLRISPFVNRLFLPFQTLLTVRDNGSRMHVDELYSQVLKRSSRDREVLVAQEKKDGVMRGEKLSDGIPLDDSKMPPVFTSIAHRNLLGFDQHGKVMTNALPLTMGWLDIEQASGLVSLTDDGRSLAEGIDQYAVDPHLISETNAYIHHYLGYDAVEIFMSEVVNKTPGEASLMLMLCEAALQGSYTTTGFAQIVYAASEPSAIAWWNDAQGRNRAVKEIEVASRRKGKKKKAEPEKKFVNSLNARLGGTQQRMKELGLLMPKKVGLSKWLVASVHTNEAANYLRKAGVEWPLGHESLWNQHMNAI